MQMDKVLFIGVILLLSACSSNKPIAESSFGEGARSAYSNTENRLIQQYAGLDIEVESPQESLRKTQAIIDKNSGYIDSTASYSAKSIDIVAKVPQQNLEITLAELKQLGRITSEQRSTHDVTDEVIDIDAKLNNFLALRARFRELLAEAKKVEDLIQIETELARIQAEIDAIESRRNSLIGSVNQAKIEIQLHQKTVLGPLGYIGKGVIWIITKLFVIK